MDGSVRYKLVLFGDTGVGKTSLVDRYINDKFKADYLSTLGYNVYEKRIPYKGDEISLMIYDIGGQERFRNGVRSRASHQYRSLQTPRQ